MLNAKPFVKWAGGKRKLLPVLLEFFNLNDYYYEPFLGGGAVAIYLMEHSPDIKRFFLNDLNKELIDVYIEIRDNIDSLIDKLYEVQNKYISSL
ncbi:MAG: DNA adenine methylase [Nitrososphaeraceae archaeon]|nr:DNA adenine methylase [Nitrososphaeraceae archaeon]